MASIRGKGTKPEITVRKFLFSRGFRYRLNHPRLPGRPDLVLRKYRSVIFVNGCFWHGHENCKYYVLPKSNTEFWQAKIERNHARDIEEQRKLAQLALHHGVGVSAEACRQRENTRVIGVHAQQHFPKRP